MSALLEEAAPESAEPGPGRHTAVTGEGDATDRNTVESWQKRFAELILPCAVRPTRSGRFSANADVVVVGGVLVARYVLSPMKMDRGEDHRIATDDSITFSVATAGKLRCTQGTHTAEFGAGEAVLLSTRSANTLETTGGGFIGIKLPRALFADCAPAHADIDFCHIGAANPALHSLLAYVDAVVRSDAEMPTMMAGLFARHMTDFIAATVGADRPAAEDDSRSARRAVRRAALQTAIDLHHADPDLTIERFAGIVGLSARTIQALFAEDETSFSDRLRETRLDKARQAIMRAGSRASIAAIAFEVGFRDISTFNRAFRRAYDRTPGEMRADAGWNH